MDHQVLQSMLLFHARTIVRNNPANLQTRASQLLREKRTKDF